MKNKVKNKEDNKAKYKAGDEEIVRKVAVLFPGIGYHCDKPLLYFSGKLAAEHGYEVIRIQYGSMPGKVKGDPAARLKAAKAALSGAEEQLGKIDWDACTDVVFISKSIGTVIANIYRKLHKVPARSVCFTPLMETFQFANGDALVFHGTADPWAPDNAGIAEACRKAGQEYYEIEGVNHSLESGSALRDLENLCKIMPLVEEYLS